MGQSTAIQKAEVDLNVPNVEIDGPGLKIGKLTKKEFVELGLKLRVVEGHLQFWIGDWARELTAQHGDITLKDACAETGISYATARQHGWVAGKFLVSRRLDIIKRKPKILYSHFMEAASAPSPDTELELMEAETTVKALRAKIKADKEAREAAGKPEPKTPRFSWIKDQRIIDGEDGFAKLQIAIEAMCAAEKDHAVAVILLEKWVTRLHNLTMRAQRGGEVLDD